MNNYVVYCRCRLKSFKKKQLKEINKDNINYRNNNGINDKDYVANSKDTGMQYLFIVRIFYLFIQLLYSVFFCAKKPYQYKIDEEKIDKAQEQ